MNTPLRTLRNNLPMSLATWTPWSPFQIPARAGREARDERSVLPIWETLWISAMLCHTHFFPPETKKRAFYSKVCSAKRVLVKYESENENQNVIRLKNIIMEANWKINAKFQHKPNAMFMIRPVLNFLLKGKHAKRNAPWPLKSWPALVTVLGIYFVWCWVFVHYAKS